MAVLHAEDIGRLASAFVVFDVHDFAFAEMVASAVRSQLLHLAGELVAKVAVLHVMIQPLSECITCVIVTDVE